VVAVSGANAIEAVNGTQFDMILMDIQLPNMNGYETTKSIRKIEQSRNRKTPIIAITAKIMPDDRAKAFAAGMDDYVAKPVSMDNLRRLCEKWLAEPAESNSQLKVDDK
jgi:CheY-like chemotaxis protein